MVPRPPRESELDWLFSPGVDIWDWRSGVTGAALLGGGQPTHPRLPARHEVILGSGCPDEPLLVLPRHHLTASLVKGICFVKSRWVRPNSSWILSKMHLSFSHPSFHRVAL